MSSTDVEPTQSVRNEQSFDDLGLQGLEYLGTLINPGLEPSENVVHSDPPPSYDVLPKYNRLSKSPPAYHAYADEWTNGDPTYEFFEVHALEFVAKLNMLSNKVHRLKHYHNSCLALGLIERTINYPYWDNIIREYSRELKRIQLHQRQDIMVHLLGEEILESMPRHVMVALWGENAMDHMPQTFGIDERKRVLDSLGPCQRRLEAIEAHINFITAWYGRFGSGMAFAISNRSRSERNFRESAVIEPSDEM